MTNDAKGEQRFGGEDAAAAGRKIYEGIREEMEANHWGQLVVIDVHTGDYEVGEFIGRRSDMEITKRLRQRRPDAYIWAELVGHPAPYHERPGRPGMGRNCSGWRRSRISITGCRRGHRIYRLVDGACVGSIQIKSKSISNSLRSPGRRKKSGNRFLRSGGGVAWFSDGDMGRRNGRCAARHRRTRSAAACTPGSRCRRAPRQPIWKLSPRGTRTATQALRTSGVC